jgi:hypothetical protein
MKRLTRDQQKKLQDDAKLAKAWRAWHAEELKEARDGPNGAIVNELMAVLDQLTSHSASALLACFERPDWSVVSYDVRLTLLHELNIAVTRLRERQGMSPFDDGVPGERNNIFRRIKALMFAALPGAHPGSNHMKRGKDERVKYG